MATPTINATSLTPIVAGAITSDYQVTIYDQAGNAGRAAVADIVAAANTIDGRYGMQIATLNIATADVLTLNATPVAFGLTVPSGFIPRLIADPMLSATYVSAAYAANTGLGIRSVGSATAVMEQASAINFTADTMKLLQLSQGANNAVLYADGTDLEVYVPTGDPTTGDSDLTITIFYILAPTP